MDRVGLQDSFRDLGGTSMSAGQVIGRIQATLGVQVAIEEFIFQTVRQLATICDDRMKLQTPPVVEAAPRRPWLRSVGNAIRAGFRSADAAQSR
jgi:hypothetical protein